MENKINIAELLKDCPKGYELYSPLCGDCILYDVNDYNIRIETPNKDTLICLYHDGRYCSNGEIMLFPKGKTTWKGFIPPCKFKDGDILTNESGNIFIYKGRMYNDSNHSDFYCAYKESDNAFIIKIDEHAYFGYTSDYRFATEEEKQKLFDAIKANGYKWNEETKSLEKLLKFKVGDRIKKKDDSDSRLRTIESINNNYYVIKTPDWFDNCYITDKLSFNCQDEYELVHSNKFDINTLKPFDSRVLVRDASCYEWEADIFGRYSDGYITLGGGKWKQCVPYEGNEHIFGTTKDCDEYYKNWE